ncbi:hypothetical protein [Mesorhizobium sp. M0213]|uniref:hypothetical protein n=1 Tax=Mesorhizobium sp. M0213 TaxID=2956917 RepID=UPI0033365315
MNRVGFWRLIAGLKLEEGQVSAIPKSVLEVLGHEWKVDEGYSAFDAVFNDREDQGRRSSPSFYHIATGKEVETDFDIFSHKEAKKLAAEHVFGSMAAVRDSGVTINEHAQHAFEDFCHEVYGAWAKYREKLDQVERFSKRPA